MWSLFKLHISFMSKLLFTKLNRDARNRVFNLFQNCIFIHRNTCSFRYVACSKVGLASKNVLHMFVQVLRPVQGVVKVNFSSDCIGFERGGLVPLTLSGVGVLAHSVGISFCIKIHWSNYVIAFISCGREVMEHIGFHIGSYRLLE